MKIPVFNSLTSKESEEETPEFFAFLLDEKTREWSASPVPQDLREVLVRRLAQPSSSFQVVRPFVEASVEMPALDAALARMRAAFSAMQEETSAPPLSEAELDFLETQIPALATAAGTTAYWEALSAGQSVMCAQGDEVWEQSPDGSRRFVKNLEPEVKVERGARLSLR